MPAPVRATGRASNPQGTRCQVHREAQKRWRTRTEPGHLDVAGTRDWAMSHLYILGDLISYQNDGKG